MTPCVRSASILYSEQLGTNLHRANGPNMAVLAGESTCRYIFSARINVWLTTFTTLFYHFELCVSSTLTFGIVIFEQTGLAQCGKQIALNLSAFLADYAWSGYQHNVNRSCQLMLMKPKRFTQQPARPVADNRTTQFIAYYHSKPRVPNRCWPKPVQQQTPGCNALAFKPDALEIAAAVEPHPRL